MRSRPATLLFLSFLVALPSYYCNTGSVPEIENPGADVSEPQDAGSDSGPYDDASATDSGTSDAAIKDTGSPADASGADAQGDGSIDSGTGSDGGADASHKVEFPPDKRGKYPVGYYHEDLLIDTARGNRNVPMHIWYPAQTAGLNRINYLINLNLGLMTGNAYDNVLPAWDDGPFPVVLFSHGFKGLAYQSFSFTEYLASHGFVVIAPNHTGNTLLDFTSKDPDVAKVTMLRPGDVGFVYQTAVKYSQTKGHMLEGLINPNLVAMTGHSFGAFTALIVSGSQADMDRAKAACQKGVEADIFCDYVSYYTPGTILKMDPKIPGLKVLVDLAPGGYNAMFDDNLAKVYIPSMTMVGTEDTTCPLDIETQPIFDALPPLKDLVIITGASHMTFTDICTNAALKAIINSSADGMCNMSIGNARAFHIINTLATAFIRKYIFNDAAMDAWLSPDYIKKELGEVNMTSVVK